MVDKKGLEYYLVGGAVRDMLMIRSWKDADFVVVGSSPEDMIARGFKPIHANQFPIFTDGRGHDWGLARREAKSGKGYHGFETDTKDVTIEEDLNRRDFTINAMAADKDGNLYFAPGTNPIKDLDDGIIRHVSDAFSEDPLRIIRMARFAGMFDFRVAKETMELAKSIVHELVEIPKERIGLEVMKAMDDPRNPAVFWNVLDEAGVFDYIMKDIKKFQSVPAGPKKYHAEGTVWAHALMACERAHPKTPRVLLGAFMHDFGKIYTDPKDYPYHPDHDNKGREVERFCRDEWKLDNDTIKAIRQSVECHMRIRRVSEMRPNTVLKLAQEMGENYHQILSVADADSEGKIPHNSGLWKFGLKGTWSRIHTANKVLKEVNADYVLKRKNKTLKDYPGKLMGDAIVECRVKRFKEIESDKRGGVQKNKSKLPKFIKDRMGCLIFEQ